jgi:hypothetical protein
MTMSIHLSGSLRVVTRELLNGFWLNLICILCQWRQIQIYTFQFISIGKNNVAGART